ncbi:hypothetical protein [Rhodanobacter sp. C05]|uniref:hypothetical protein n=1 Tax=Rhodanobacter sp. C05 TaxID=1945855 RepID=UPI00098637D3|nr:hypothetical protein [Rhodanobacter sp. C05]
MQKVDLYALASGRWKLLSNLTALNEANVRAKLSLQHVEVFIVPGEVIGDVEHNSARASIEASAIYLVGLLNSHEISLTPELSGGVAVRLERVVRRHSSHCRHLAVPEDKPDA